MVEISFSPPRSLHRLGNPQPMEIAPLAIIAAIILAGTLIFSLCLVRCYIKPANGTCLISFGCVLAISSALWCVLLIPADVYTVRLPPTFERAGSYRFVLWSGIALAFFG